MGIEQKWNSGNDNSEILDPIEQERQRILRENKSKEMIHTDFKYIENGWHGNKEYLNQKDTTLPGFSYQFNFTDDAVNAGMFEDSMCEKLPIKIYRKEDGTYKGETYSDTEENANIEYWIEHYAKEKGADRREAA